MSTHSIMMVEDDWNLAVLYGRALEKHGNEVVIAVNGGQAVDMAAARELDLIVMDLELPDRHGLDVISDLRTSPITKELPMVILSSHHAPELVRRADELGVLAYLVKLDTSPERLANAIDDLLRTARPAKA
jgi:CheY-like chemotaxis protein